MSFVLDLRTLRYSFESDLGTKILDFINIFIVTIECDYLWYTRYIYIYILYIKFTPHFFFSDGDGLRHKPCSSRIPRKRFSSLNSRQSQLDVYFLFVEIQWVGSLRGVLFYGDGWCSTRSDKIIDVSCLSRRF